MRSNTKQALLVTVVGVTLFVALLRLSDVLAFAAQLVDLVLPILAGGILALFLSVPMAGLEKRLGRLFAKARKQPSGKALHLLSFLLTLLGVVLVLVLALTLLIPELVQSFHSLYLQIEANIPRWTAYLHAQDPDMGWLMSRLEGIDWEQLLHKVTSGLDTVLVNAAGAVSATVNLVVTASFALIISVYLSLGAQSLGHQARTLVRAYLKPGHAAWVLKFCRLFRQSFANFLTGQCSEAVILGMLFNDKLTLHLSNVRAFRLDMRLMKNIFYIGVPSGVENGMFQLGRLVLFSLISTFGTASMVANAIGNTIANFNCFAGQAINLGLAAVVSQCVGAGEFDQARAYLRKIVKWTYGIMAVVNLTIIALLPLIMRVYNVSPEAEKLAVTVTLIHGISSIFIWVPAFMVPGFLRAAGDAKFTMLASMLTMWVVRVLLAYVLGKYMGYGVIGVWFAHAIVDWTVRGAIFLLRYRSGKWETMGIKT